MSESGSGGASQQAGPGGTSQPGTPYAHTCMIRGDGGRSIRAVLDRICDKWTLLIVATLEEKRMRFGELQQHVPGISQRMLTLTLRNLTRDGLVSRTAYAEVPPRVEYALTPLGRSLIPPALALAAWAVENNARILESRAAHEEAGRKGAGPADPAPAA